MVPRLSKVLSKSGHAFRERDLSTFCRGCAADRNISDCLTLADTEVRTYRCRHCLDLLVVVGHPSDRPISGEQAGPGSWWSIRPKNELRIHVGSSELTIPACPRSSLFGEPLL